MARIHWPTPQRCFTSTGRPYKARRADWLDAAHGRVQFGCPAQPAGRLPSRGGRTRGRGGCALRQNPSGQPRGQIHSTQIDAFLSAGALPLGTVGADGKVRWDIPAAPPAPSAPAALDPHVLLIKLTPDLEPTFFSALHGYPKVILETFGAGGIPARLEHAVRALIESGTRVYITSQCNRWGRASASLCSRSPCRSLGRDLSRRPHHRRCTRGGHVRRDMMCRGSSPYFSSLTCSCLYCTFLFFLFCAIHLIHPLFCTIRNGII